MYLVQRLEIDSLENSYEKALSYETVGYVDNADDASHLLSEEVVGTGWPIPKGEVESRYRLIELQKIRKAA